MADSAREHLDVMIARCTRTASMLNYLKSAVEEANPKRTDVHQEDVISALDHAAGIVSQHRINLEEVRAIYDAKVNGIGE